MEAALIDRWINKGKAECGISIENAEKHYNAIYVTDMCIRDKHGNWSEQPVSIFWVEKPEKPEYSNYLGIFMAFNDNGRNSVYLTNAISATEEPFYGVMADNGEIIYSRYRHDYRVSEDKTATADGGRDYFRGNGQSVRLQIVGPDVVIVE